MMVHAGLITFSPSTFTLLTSEQLSSGLTSDNVDKLLRAATPLLEDYFADCIPSEQKKWVLQSCPRVRWCVKEAVTQVRRRTGLPSMRHLLAVTCVTAVVLAEREKIVRVKPTFDRLYRATNIYRYIHLKELGHTVRMSETGDGSSEDQSKEKDDWDGGR